MSDLILNVVSNLIGVLLAVVIYAAVGWVYRHLRDQYLSRKREINTTITSNVIYHTTRDKYLNMTMANNYVYWDTTGSHLISKGGIEILQEKLLGMKSNKGSSSMAAMFPIIQEELEDLLIVPCIHFKKGKKIKYDFLNAYKFDEL